MKLVNIIFALVSIFIINSAIQAEGKGELVLRVTEIPPMYFQTHTGEWTGRDYSIAKRIIENAGYSLRIVTMPWKRALTELIKGELVDVLAGVTPNQERAKDYLFIGPYDYEEIGLIVKKEDENLPIHTVSDLIEHLQKTKMKVGYHRGYIFPGEFKKYATNKRYSHGFTNYEQGGKMLRANRIIGFIAQRAVSQYQIDNGVEHMRGLVVHSFIFRRAPNYLALSKKSDPQVYVDLVSSFDELKWTDVFEEIKKTKWKKPVKSVENLNLITALEPPQQYLEDGKLQGIGIDVISAVQNEIGSSYKISHFPWARGMKNAKINKNSIMFLAAKTLDREPHFIFLGPILAKKYYLYKRSTDNLMIESLEAARNVESIASVQSDVRTKYLINQKFSNIHLMRDHQQGLLMLTRGRVDLWTSSDWELSSQLKAADISFSQVIPVYELFKKYNYIIINNQTNPKTIREWKKALRKIKDDGTMDNIAAKWSKKLNLNLHFSKKSDAIEIKLE